MSKRPPTWLALSAPLLLASACTCTKRPCKDSLLVQLPESAVAQDGTYQIVLEGPSGVLAECDAVLPLKCVDDASDVDDGTSAGAIACGTEVALNLKPCEPVCMNNACTMDGGTEGDGARGLDSVSLTEAPTSVRLTIRRNTIVELDETLTPRYGTPRSSCGGDCRLGVAEVL